MSAIRTNLEGMCLKFPIDQNKWVFAPPVWQTDGIQSTHMYKKNPMPSKPLQSLNLRNIELTYYNYEDYNKNKGKDQLELKKERKKRTMSGK